jgi:hypothetical protein
MNTKLISASLLAVLLVTGCSTLVRIDTSEPGATVILNRKEIGETPLEKKLSNDVFKKYDVIIKKDGYKTIHSELEKEVKAGPIIGGLFFLWPLFLWCYGPEAYQEFELVPVK